MENLLLTNLLMKIKVEYLKIINIKKEISTTFLSFKITILNYQIN